MLRVPTLGGKVVVSTKRSKCRPWTGHPIHLERRRRRPNSLVAVGFHATFGPWRGWQPNCTCRDLASELTPDCEPLRTPAGWLEGRTTVCDFPSTHTSLKLSLYHSEDERLFFDFRVDPTAGSTRASQVAPAYRWTTPRQDLGDGENSIKWARSS